MALWTWDIESVEWDRPRCVVAISENGDVERWSGPGCLEHAASFMDDVRGTFAAHAGGIYDTLLLTNVRERPWRELLMSGSAILCARDGNLRVRDTFRWFLNGLKKIGEYLERLDDEREARGEPRKKSKGGWLKRDVDRKRIEDLTETEALTYCESDCEILLEGVQQARAYLEAHKAKNAWTSGSSALHLLEQIEPASWRLLGRSALDLDTAIAANECVRGARVECWALGRRDTVYVYDFKSSYPASYADLPLGVGARRLYQDDSDVAGAVWRVRWHWPWRDRIPPVLDQATNRGAGWCEAWCIQEEVEALQEHVDVIRLEGWAPERMTPLGGAFVRDLYAEKERGSFFGKVFLNSLHGKFSESPVKKCWQSVKPKEWFGPDPVLVGDYWHYLDVNIDKRGRVARHIQPIAAAQILGRARTRLLARIHAVLDAGGDVYYCDTDSIHTNLAPSKMPCKLGVDLGDLACEGGPYVGLYAGPKAYALLDTSSGVAVKGALKGVPWNALRDGLVDAGVYREARGRESGSDLRTRVYDEIFAATGARIQKEGISTWVSGLKKGEGWYRARTVRTIRPQTRGKVFRGSKWLYENTAPISDLDIAEENTIAENDDLDQA